MFYSKPKNVTYTQMAIWIDENGSTSECDQQKLFEYLFHLCYILAYKWRYFNNGKDYEEFSLYAASIIFKRYLNKELRPIKSSLNYIKKVLHIYKITFQREFFQESVSTISVEGDSQIYDIALEQQLQDKCSQLNRVEFQVYLENIPQTILGSIRHRIPRRRHSAEFNNIYISCLLTFLDLITPSEKEQKQLASITRGDGIYTNLYLKLYKIPDSYVPILYHLDSSYRDYILLLVKIIRASIRNDLKELLYQQYPLKDLCQDILESYSDDNGQP